MLTIDDCNTILKKYGEQGYWREFDLADIPLDVERMYYLEEIKISIYLPTFWVITPFPTCLYFTNHDGEIININGTMGKNSNGYNWAYNLRDIDNDMIIHIFTVIQDIDISQYDIHRYPFTPLSPLKISVIDGGFDEKFYIANPDRILTDYTINDVIVPLETDEHGTYLTLPSSEDCYVGGREDSDKYIPFKVTFFKSKELPIPYIPSLYRGTPQSIQVLNTKDDDPISDYQTYYQGRTLKDNTIQLPYDSEDYVDIVVDLKDYRYPFCRVKLKAPTTLYTASSQAEVETAIEQGIRTLQVVNNNTAVTLTDITLTDVLFINSKIAVSESTLTNVSILDTTYTDNGDNSLTDCTIKSSTLTSANNPSTYTECKILECDITGMELHLTGTLTDNELTETLIISDGVIEITDNIFTDKNSKDYFPSFLYLTGTYEVKNNTFTLDDEWTEPAFNMCIIKTIDPFTPNQFISNNTFDLNIEYSTEDPNTFYYNIVDDDKIKAVRLD